MPQGLDMVIRQGPPPVGAALAFAMMGAAGNAPGA